MVPGDSNVIQTCPSGLESLLSSRDTIDRDDNGQFVASVIVFMMMAGRKSYIEIKTRDVDQQAGTLILIAARYNQSLQDIVR